MDIVDYVIIGVSIAIMAILFSPKIRKNKFWQATVTPLASIIGSGFLIIAPVMGEVAGSFAPLVMIGIVVFAYFLGAVIRFNILHTEPLLTSGQAKPFHRYMERTSDIAVFIAYLISVAFYLRIMSAFLLKAIDTNTSDNALYLTTGILLILAVIGIFKGLKVLEKLEEYSVSIKLGIIGSLLIGLIFYNVSNGENIPPVQNHSFDFTSLAQLAGMLIVVQGFETSRYLGDEYDARTRIGSMRIAQIISGIIYLLFIFLVMPLLGLADLKSAGETAIIDLSGHVSIILPVLLVLAATMSQFSASIADTLGGGGLLKEQTNGRVPARVGYVCICLGAIVLIWSANIFEIITIASRAFAFYYFMQTLVALQTARQMPPSLNRTFGLVCFSILALILAGITLFSIPIE
ncbi:MAG: hypothetical protein V7750_06535 [Sneathiella sp.]